MLYIIDPRSEDFGVPLDTTTPTRRWPERGSEDLSRPPCSRTQLYGGRMTAQRRINVEDRLHRCNRVTFSGRAGSSLIFPTVGYCTGALFHAIASPVGSNLNRWRSTRRTTSATAKTS